MPSTRTETKEITVPLAYRQRMFERKADFGQRIANAIAAAVVGERAWGWELDEPTDFESLQRAGRIKWHTSFTFNPLGDMNEATAVTVRLQREMQCLVDE